MQSTVKFVIQFSRSLVLLTLVLTMAGSRRKRIKRRLPPSRKKPRRRRMSSPKL
jgi:hypothetical protein